MPLLYINGFTNKDIRFRVFPDNYNDIKYRNKTTRLLAKLRAHGLIRKVPRSFKYHVSKKGLKVMPVIMYIKQKEYTSYLLKIAN